MKYLSITVYRINDKDTVEEMRNKEGVKVTEFIRGLADSKKIIPLRHTEVLKAQITYDVNGGNKIALGLIIFSVLVRLFYFIRKVYRSNKEVY